MLKRQGPLLKATTVTRREGGTTVLDQVSVVVDVGERVGLIGPGGAGKTALFDVVTGLSTAAAGSVWFDGHALRGLEPHRIMRLGLARTFQAPRPLPGGTVRDAVRLAAAAAATASEGIGLGSGLRRGDERRERLAQAAEVALWRAGMIAWADQPTGGLPRPQRVYLDIARALTAEPQMLLLDQPTLGFAAEDRRQFAALFRHLSGEGVTLLLADHDLALVASLCPRVVVLHRGRRIAEGPPERVGASPEVLRAFAGRGW